MSLTRPGGRPTLNSQSIRCEFLTSERVGADLEFYDLAFRAFAAFYVPCEVGSIVGIKRAAFPSASGIVDAGVHAAGVEA